MKVYRARESISPGSPQGLFRFDIKIKVYSFVLLILEAHDSVSLLIYTFMLGKQNPTTFLLSVSILSYCSCCSLFSLLEFVIRFFFFSVISSLTMTLILTECHLLKDQFLNY